MLSKIRAEIILKSSLFLGEPRKAYRTGHQPLDAIENTRIKEHIMYAFPRVPLFYIFNRKCLL